MGRAIDDSNKLHWYLRGLGAEFSTFSATQMAISPLPSFADITSRAMSLENFQTSLYSDHTPLAAFFARSGPSTNSTGRVFSQNQRFGSNGSNHSAPRGNNFNGNRGGKHNGCYEKKRPPRRQICKNEGHVAMNCHVRYSPQSQDANLAEVFAGSCSLRSPEVADWCMDSGASAHMTPSTSNLDYVSPYGGNSSVTVGNGASLPVSHIGSCSINFDFTLLNVMVVPHITRNLLSNSRLTRDYDVTVAFSKDFFVIQNRKTGTPLAQGWREDGLYILRRATNAFLAALHKKRLHGSFSLWHARLGHVNHSVLSLLNKKGILSLSSVLPDPSICAPC